MLIIHSPKQLGRVCSAAFDFGEWCRFASDSPRHAALGSLKGWDPVPELFHLPQSLSSCPIESSTLSLSLGPFSPSWTPGWGRLFGWILGELGTHGSDALPRKDPSPQAEICRSTCQEPWENPHYTMRREERSSEPVSSMLWAKSILSLSLCISLFSLCFFWLWLCE